MKYNKEPRIYPAHIGETNYTVFKSGLVRRECGTVPNKETEVFCILEQDADLVLVFFLQ